MSNDSSRYLFKHHPETCDPDDIWGQVKRTVAGKPVSAEQIALIVESITTGLKLGSSDVLLDLCCGNGALTTHIFEACSGGLGVDYSAFLIEVANRRFVRNIHERYIVSDAMAYLETEAEPERYTKALCYGAFSYFDEDVGHRFLKVLNERFRNVSHVLLGQLPDKSRMDAFFTARTAVAGEENDPGSLMGIWRTPAEMTEFARSAGWELQCQYMPAEFYAGHYRFNAILIRP